MSKIELIQAHKEDDTKRKKVRAMNKMTVAAALVALAVGEKLTVMPFVETVWMDNRRFQSRYGGIPQGRFLGGAFATMTTGVRLTWRIDDNWRLFVRFRQYDIINNQSRRAVKKQTAYYAKCDYPIVGAGIECSF